MFSRNYNMFLPNSGNDSLMPMVYQLVAIEGTDDWKLEPLYGRFPLPAKIYGKTPKYVRHIWKAYKRNEETMSLLLIGLKGSGKTETGSILANTAIDNGMAVIMITDIKPNEKMAYFLNKLRNVVLFFDEFGKVIPVHMQDKYLTMFSDLNKSNKLFILTENYKHNINQLLWNRPGRIRYKIHFTRVEKDTVMDYCKDKKVKKSFMDDLLKEYIKAPEFVMDHLIAIVDEHLIDTSISLKEMLEYLNVEISNDQDVLTILKIENTKTNTVLIPNVKNISPAVLNKHYGPVPIVIIEEIDKDGNKIEPIKSNRSVDINMRGVESINGDDYVFKDGDYLIHAIKEKGILDKVANNNNRGFGGF